MAFETQLHCCNPYSKDGYVSVKKIYIIHNNGWFGTAVLL